MILTKFFAKNKEDLEGETKVPDFSKKPKKIQLLS